MNQPTETPVFSKTEGEHALQVWPHPYRGSVEIRSHGVSSHTGADVLYLLSGAEEVLTFARDVVATAGLEEETFIVSRAISYPVERAHGRLACGVGNNEVSATVDVSPELLETMAANLAAIAADIRAGRKLEEIQQAELKLRERQDGIVRALFGEGLDFLDLGEKARTAVETAIEAQDELARQAKLLPPVRECRMRGHRGRALRFVPCGR